jgi:hypothetical protein
MAIGYLLALKRRCLSACYRRDVAYKSRFVFAPM